MNPDAHSIKAEMAFRRAEGITRTVAGMSMLDGSDRAAQISDALKARAADLIATGHAERREADAASLADAQPDLDALCAAVQPAYELWDHIQAELSGRATDHLDWDDANARLAVLSPAVTAFLDTPQGGLAAYAVTVVASSFRLPRLRSRHRIIPSVLSLRPGAMMWAARRMLQDHGVSLWQDAIHDLAGPQTIAGDIDVLTSTESRDHLATGAEIVREVLADLLNEGGLVWLHGQLGARPWIQRRFGSEHV